MKNLVILGVIVVLIVGSIIFLTRSKEESKIITTSEGEQVQTGLLSGELAEEGKLAPDFTLVDFEGNLVKLSDFKGKAVFIDFWAAWCPFCTDEMPEVEKLHQEFGGDVVILGIHRTNTESKEVGEAFAREEINVTYVLLQDKTDEVYKAFTSGISGMPVAAWLDKNGVVVKLKIGPKTLEEMRQNIELTL